MDEQQRRKANMDVLGSLQVEDLKKKNKKKFEETGEFPKPVEEPIYEAPKNPIISLEDNYKKKASPEADAQARYVELMEKEDKSPEDLKELGELKKKIEEGKNTPAQDETVLPPPLVTGTF